MAILYGKVRIYSEPGQTITITNGRGASRTIQTTGTTFTDVTLPGMEEYNFTNGTNTGYVTLNYDDFKFVSL